MPRQRSLRLVGAVVAGLALAGSATAAGRGRDTGPTHAAVEVYDDGGAGEVVRLAVADLRTGALVTLRTGNIDNATWSPGGTLLAFAVDGGLAVYRLSGEANTPAAVRLVLDVSGPYGPEQVPQLWPPRPVWSADGARLAHRIGDEVVVYDVSADTPRKLAAIRTAPGDPDYQFAPVGQSLVIRIPTATASSHAAAPIHHGSCGRRTT